MQYKNVHECTPKKADNGKINRRDPGGKKKTAPPDIPTHHEKKNKNKKVGITINWRQSPRGYVFYTTGAARGHALNFGGFSRRRAKRVLSSCVKYNVCAFFFYDAKYLSSSTFIALFFHLVYYSTNLTNNEQFINVLFSTSAIQIANSNEYNIMQMSCVYSLAKHREVKLYGVYFSSNSI